MSLMDPITYMLIRIVSLKNAIDDSYHGIGVTKGCGRSYVAHLLQPAGSISDTN